MTTPKPEKQPRGHAWRKGPACKGKRAMASWNTYKRNAPAPTPIPPRGTK